QSDTIVFNTPGTYTATVTVFATPTCSEVISTTVEVVQNCLPAIIISNPVFTNCSNITLNVSGGTGAKTYTVVGTYVNVVSTAVPPGGNITLNTSTVPPGVTDEVLFTVTDANGCTNEITISYEKCAGTD